MAEEEETFAEQHEEEEDEEDSDVDVEDDGAEEHDQEEGNEGEGDGAMQEHENQEEEGVGEEENENVELEEEGGEGEAEEEQDLVREGGEGEETKMEADANGGEDHEAKQAEAEEAPANVDVAKAAEPENRGGQKWDGDADKDPMKLPPHGTEVFVGGIPPGTTEEDLKEALGSAGEIFSVRIARDPFDQSPKGFAFVTFRGKEAAAKAVAEFTELEIKGKSVRVNNSQSKHRLFVGGIPRDLSKDELRKCLDEVIIGAESIDVPTNPQNPSLNRGFLFIDFYNHAAADHSRRKMTRHDYRMAGRTVTVSWAEGKSADASPSELAQVKVLYVKGLPESATDERLRELFIKYGEIERAVIPPAKPGQPPRNFGFVHFADRKAAIAAMEKDQKHEMDGNELEVSLARPPPERQSRAPAAVPMAAFASYQQPYGGYATSARGGGSAYGAYGTAFGSSSGARRGGQAQSQAAVPFIQAPAGMTMVPMQLPDGQVGYILQQAGAVGPARGTRQGATYGLSSGSGQSGRRYHPYN